MVIAKIITSRPISAARTSCVKYNFWNSSVGNDRGNLKLNFEPVIISWHRLRLAHLLVSKHAQ